MRPEQRDCRQEPSYPDHATVVFALRWPDLTCHDSSARCQTQEPHLVAECGEYAPEGTDG